MGIGVAEIAYGLLVNSISLVADGVHSLADSIVSALVLAGIVISKRMPNRVFSHGYARAETLFGLLAAVGMVVLGGLMFYESYSVLLSPSPIEGVNLAIAVAVASGVVSLALALLKLHLARSSGSLALRIDAYNSIKDGSASFVVVAGVGLSSLGYIQLDPLAGMVISVMIIAVGYFSIKESSVVLMDGCLCPERIERISSIALSVNGVLGIRDVRLRRLGRSVACQAVVMVDPSATVAEVHGITTALKKRIINEFPDISDIVLEIEPSEPASPRLNSINA